MPLRVFRVGTVGDSRATGGDHDPSQGHGEVRAGVGGGGGRGGWVGGGGLQYGIQRWAVTLQNQTRRPSQIKVFKVKVTQNNI